ncbi:C2 domain-containing protein [Peribacillus huizhouensis]|uniref:C2 domain-containing protein n=1 Tax=Peribacillus huizhouensis TaxID=1501239 RepID=A0ABR6CN91_9BACI|nr:C2 domain-containing protein [Peribacillus huizhouensis]MBA9026394.1 hypothetical protein [Peribacillus huizhouensis]
MFKKMIGTVLAGMLLFSSFGAFNPHKAQAASTLEIAEYWAPEFYQDVNDTYGYSADFVTNFDYDGDWVGNNNWENLNKYPMKSYIYYSVVETSSHYFIGYYDYHARDDGPTVFDKHENDLEGVLVIIRKDGTPYGTFQLMETVAHNQFYQYTNDPSITTGADNIDGGVLFNGTHPKVFIQSNGQSPIGGHGNYAYDGTGAPGGDGIVYYYGNRADVVTNASGNYTNKYSYDLVSFDEFWKRRNDIGNGQTFGSWGKLDGDTYQQDSAAMPWVWDDLDDNATFAGDFLSDPAHMVDTHLNGLGNFPHTYINHPYYSHRIQVNSVTSLKNRDPFGGKSDIFVKIRVNGNGVSDDRLWKKNDVPTNTAYNVAWGTMDATFGNQYSEYYNDRYVNVPANSQINVEVYDSDGVDGDDEMGILSAYPAVGQTVEWNNTTTSNGEAKVKATIWAVR